MERIGSVTTASTSTVCPVSRFISARKPPDALAGDLVPGSVEDRGLAFEDDDQRVTRVADPEQELSPPRSRALLTHRSEGLKLPRRKGWG